ncbi:hypothetical protein CISIN_1g038974mg [Citrus sinensis]|uniref:NAC domain-containing protein n=2 Tax=Citrus sinensis TaxID=2711 RepID=A0A067D0I6_CITSI|nr:hypothetical protein CISIN_1g038974mg [Citrus sinensis]
MLPPGVVFNPTEEDRVSYLIGKVSGHTDGGGSYFIQDIQLCEHEPWELLSLAHDCCHQQMYFTHLRSRYHSEMVYREAVCGFWKNLGLSSYINDKGGKPVAVKKSLNYYKKDVKTQWLMTCTHFCTITSIRHEN